jgi:ribonuclease D
MTFITTQTDLDAYIARIKGQAVIFLDTEFLRERTYYAQLCVVQAKIPGDDPVAIDALSPDLELLPFWDALSDKNMTKVFHSGKQDLEIIFQASGNVPTPLFDTQIAASVLGYGEQAGFETLARTVLKTQLDKGSQFTDWARRPLTDRQLKYALDDVRYLEPIYDHLVSELATKNRVSWMADDVAELSNPKTYQVDLNTLWRRVKIKSDKPRDLAVLRSITAWREIEAQARDLPRGRIIKDDPLGEIALHHPRTLDELSAIRGIDKGMVKGKLGQGLLDAVANGLAVADDDCPRIPRRKGINDEQELLLDILKLIVKMRAREMGVAAKMLASSDELDSVVRDGFDGSVLSSGWRYDAIGRDLVEKTQFAFEMDVKGQRVSLKK